MKFIFLVTNGPFTSFVNFEGFFVSEFVLFNVVFCIFFRKLDIPSVLQKTNVLRNPEFIILL